MKSTTFTIPGPPVGKERPRRGAHGGFYTPAKTKAYEEQIGFFAKEAGIQSVLTICHLDVKWRRNFDGEDELEITLVQTDDMPPKGKRGPDGDNVLKCCGDGLQGIGFHNDSQVNWWSIGKEW